MVVNLCGWQIDHHYAGLGIALEVRGVFQARCVNDGCKSELRIVRRREPRRNPLQDNETGVLGAPRNVTKEYIRPIDPLFTSSSFRLATRKTQGATDRFAP
jgi:hypothetical protein